MSVQKDKASLIGSGRYATNFDAGSDAEVYDEEFEGLIRQMLERLGYEVTASNSSVEALSLFCHDPEAFDLIITDLGMPGLDGMDVLKTIKQRWPESQVVVITGYPTIESAKEAVRMGAFNYIAKPVGPDEVVKAANEAMTQKRWTLRSVPTVSH